VAVHIFYNAQKGGDNLIYALYKARGLSLLMLKIVKNGHFALYNIIYIGTIIIVGLFRSTVS